MNTIVVHNPTEAQVEDYPIMNPESKDVKLWSIYPGETLEFPEYAGRYLLEVYGFLQRIVTDQQLREEREQEEKVSQGKQFSQIKIVSSLEDGSMSANIDGDAVSQAQGVDVTIPEVKAQKGGRICPVCRESFRTEANFKMHYASKHVNI